MNIAFVTEALNVNLCKEAKLMTDKAKFYKKPGKGFAAHNTVDHAKVVYVRKGDNTIHTNTIEDYFSFFKRGLKGVYQHLPYLT